MKNIIKKIFTLIAAGAFVVPAVSSAATFNTASNDLPTIQVTNYTTNPNCATCWSSSANANAGNVVSFFIYYHNTGSDTANNVRIRLTPQTTGVGSSHVFTATVTADNASAVTGVATVTLSSNQTISYLSGQTVWRPNQTQSGSTALPFGQTGMELFNGTGLNIGNIAPGWASQGGLAVRFQVSGTTGGYTGGWGTTGMNVSTQGVTSVTGESAILLGYLDPAGTADAVRWFEWGTSAGFGYQTARVQHGTGISQFSVPISGLLPNTTYYYRAVAQSAQGLAYGTTMSFVTNFSTSGTYYGSYNQPTVNTVTASPSSDTVTLTGYVDPRGTMDTVRWFEWGPTGALGNQTPRAVHGMYSANYTAVVSGLLPNTTYYYRAVAQNTQGTVYGSTLTFMTQGSSYTNTGTTYGSAPAATTLLATDNTSSSARLNGLVFSNGGQSSNAWFEWGESSALGNRTTMMNVGTLPSVRHDAIISGLVNGRTYYYRIVAENTYGRAIGSTLSFVAGEAPATNTSVVVSHTTTSVVRATTTQASMIAIDGGSEKIANNEQREYRVSWKNTNGSALKNVVVRAMLPQTMNFDSATKGVFSKADNMVTIEVGTLAAKDSGEATIVATTDRGVANGQLIVVTANMVYTTSANAQGDAVAYVTHHVERAQNAFGANLFNSGAFLPTTLFEWMILVILVLVLVLLGNHLYGRFSGSAH